jgi:prepilin-type N-terminal cleavage/methylation domain-containing protein
MKVRASSGIDEMSKNPGRSRSSRTFALRARDAEQGFTLVELLIVTTILPLIIGALSVGLISVFSLQSGVSSRLSNTTDAQVVAADFQTDVQGTSEITTASATTYQCTSTPPTVGTQLLGLWSNVNNTNTQLMVSYVSVTTVNGSTTTYSLKRLDCLGTANINKAVVTTLSSNLPASQAAPTVTCVANVPNLCSNTMASQGWVSSQNVAQVSMTVAEPSTATDKNTGAYTYSLVASPAASSSTSNSGSPVNTQATTNCYKASPGTGPLANNLCFVDFTPLLNPAYMAVAETPGTCLEMSASLGPNYNYDKLFFCISITEPDGSNPTTGATPTNPEPWPVPTYTGAFFGNLVTVNTKSYAFYTGIPGNPAIYERLKGNYADLTNVTFSNIKVVTGSNALATNWSIISADAESTDQSGATAGEYESLTWTTNPEAPLSVVPNDIPVLDGTNQIYPAGNACLSDQTVSGIVGGVGTATPNSITCNSVMSGEQETGNPKTGAAMVQATMPTTMTVNLVSGGAGYQGLQGIVFGMYLP